ncbi:MAG: Flp pilus assembly protein CpaB [Inquilinus sp.]|nr:Flp pilus assembly protein CpaB [Inquilinus sp.]
MVVRVVVLLGLALLIGVGTVIFAQNWIAEQREGLVPVEIEVATTPERMVLVTRTNLPRGLIVRPENLAWQAWPTDNLPQSYAVQGARDIQEFIGSVVRVEMAAGEPVTDVKMVKPGERGFMAAVLKPGMRAVSVPISDTRASAGFISPGDRVDVILTHEPGGGGDGRGRMVSETIFKDVLVLAIDQALATPEGQARIGKTATLEVTPRLAEAFTLMTQLGTITLVLRPLEAVDQESLIATLEEPSKGETEEKTPSAAYVDPTQNLLLEGEDEHAIRRQAQTFTSPRDVSALIGGGGGGGAVVIIRGNGVQR